MTVPLRYVAFEGGGGKGAAYLGAIDALERFRPKEQDKGSGTLDMTYGGSSAGAATALALALGIDADTLYRILVEDQRFSTKVLLQPARTEPPRYCAVIQLPDATRRLAYPSLPPVCYGLLDASGTRSNWFSGTKMAIKLADLVAKAAMPVPAAIVEVLYALGISQKVDISAYEISRLLNLGGAFDGDALHRALLGLAANMKDQPKLNALMDGGWNSVTQTFECSFDGDGNVLAVDGAPTSLPRGGAASQWLRRAAGQEAEPAPYGSVSPYLRAANAAMPPGAGRAIGRSARSRRTFTAPGWQPNFRQLREARNVDLVVTGTNLNDGLPYYFSSDLTPDFPVLAAVMISMTFPFLWSPVYVHYTTPKGHRYDGWYVDGGLLVNLPLRGATAAKIGQHSGIVDAAPLYGTAGFFLDEPKASGQTEPRLVDVVPSLLGAWIENATASALAGHKSLGRSLSAKGLKMLDFDPPRDVVDKLRKSNGDTAYEFLTGGYTA